MRYVFAIVVALINFGLVIAASLDLFGRERVDLSDPSQWIFFALALVLGFSTGRVLRRVLGITDSFW